MIFALARAVEEPPGAPRLEVPTERASSSRDQATAAGAQAAADLAFTRFYDATKGPVRSYLAAATRDPGVADDLTQEAFLRLYSVKKAFDGEEHRRRYLFRIASNLLVDHWRAAHRAALPLSDEMLAGPLEAAFTAASPDLDARRDLSRAWGRIPPRDRQLVWLAHVEQLDHREIADLTGLRRASVRVLLFRARRRLAAALTGGAALEGGSK
ncbi:MAG: sigma-70 family RNA polymerase sigma factor [Thermoanaerobaculia bacterium]